MDLLSSFETSYGADLIGCTVVRIIGQLQFVFTTDPSLAVMGIMHGASTLDTVDVLPYTTPHLDWMFYHAVTGESQGAALYGRAEFDLRGMRKIDELNETIWWAAERTVAAGATTVDGQISCLVKLP